MKSPSPNCCQLAARLYLTIDAMGCQREIAQQIVDGGADSYR